MTIQAIKNYLNSTGTSNIARGLGYKTGRTLTDFAKAWFDKKSWQESGNAWTEVLQGKFGIPVPIEDSISTNSSTSNLDTNKNSSEHMANTISTALTTELEKQSEAALKKLLEEANQITNPSETLIRAIEDLKKKISEFN